MAGFSDDIVEAFLDALYSGVALPLPTEIQVGLSSTEPADDGTNITEPTNGDYARAITDANTTDWPLCTPGTRQKANGVEVGFPEATDDWDAEPLQWFFQTDQSDNFLGWGRLRSPITVSTGDRPNFAPGVLVMRAPGSG